MADKKISHEDIFDDDLFGFVNKAGDKFLDILKEAQAQLQQMTKIKLDNIKLADPKTLGDVETTRKATKAIDEYAKAQDKLQKAQSDGAKIIAIINERTRQATQANRDAAKAHESANTAQENTITNLRQMQKELAKLPAGSNEFNELAKKAGLMRDKIEDAKNAVKAFSSESKLTNAKTLFGQIGTDLKDLNFADAADKAKQFAAVVRSMTFGEVIGGLKNFGATLIGIGEALLANPFTLFIAGITAVIAVIVRYKDQLFGLTDAQKEKIKADDGELIADEKLREQYNKNIKTIRDLQVEYAVLTGAMDNYQGELAKITNKTNDELAALNKSTKENLQETGGWWGALKISIAASVGLGSLEAKKQQDQITDITSAAAKVRAQLGEIDTEEKKIALAKENAAIFKIIQEAQEEINKKKEEDAKKEAAKRKQRLAEELAERKRFDAEILALENEADGNKRKEVEDEQKKRKKDDDDMEADMRARATQDYKEQKAREDIADELRKERLKKIQDFAEKSVQATFKEIEEKNKAEKDYNTNKLSELDKQIQFQQQLALNGESNTLAILQKERAKALEQQAILDKKAAKEKEAEQVAELFLEFMKVYAKDGFGAAAKATALTVLAKTASKAIAGTLYEGQEDIGRADRPLDAKGGRLYVLHDNESVVTGHGTKETPGLVTAVNDKGFLGAQEWAMKNIPMLQDRSKGDQVNNAIMSMVAAKLDKIDQTLADLPDVDFKRNVYGELVRMEKRNGIVNEYTTKITPSAYSKH